MKTQNYTLLSGQPYSAPSAAVLDMVPEGPLCASGDMTINDWEYDENGSVNF